MILDDIIILFKERQPAREEKQEEEEEVESINSSGGGSGSSSSSNRPRDWRAKSVPLGKFFNCSTISHLKALKALCISDCMWKTANSVLAEVSI
ncbi:hypothetical protein T4C_6051 [Trichinella pseudospiralis]|uniref:Uncharacterized protein n=1 Tax=Trichinella pseudospiralis TaxID=6337 RepID=A0A0V1J2G5_TRIPS|nr:hypothetical protein T4C_6051 [Trichinella pseudospiralis]